MMQIRNELASMRYRSNGTWKCPLVIRVPVGGYIHGAICHSQSIDGYFMHMPGIRIAYPSNASDAKGLLKAACRMDDPVIFMEHKRLYMTKCEVPDDLKPIPLGKGRVRKSGEDITIVAIQRMNLFAEEAARKLETESIRCEIIDPRTYSPLDEELIFSSVKKTGRVIVVDESNPKCSLASEITSLISEKCFYDLKGPIAKITAPHTPVSYTHLTLPTNREV